jgi:outer membrane immunogenic protein
MFKKIVAASLAAATMTASAYAADLRPAPYVPPPPVYTWTGAYIGLNAGGFFERNNNDANGLFAVPGGCDPRFPGCALPPNFSTLLANGINSLNGFNNNNGRRGGFIGGGQIGINFQWTPTFVFGAELDAQGVWSGNNDNNNNFGVAVVPSPAFPAERVVVLGGFNHRLEALGTARARAGFLATPAFLIYATGGAAIGETRTRGFLVGTNDTSPGRTTGISSVNGSTTRVGWTAGGGIEWMFMPNWSLKAEALYYDLGRFRTAMSPVAISGLAGTAVPGGLYASALPVISFREQGVIARAGINYHFFSAPAAPVVARY